MMLSVALGPLAGLSALSTLTPRSEIKTIVKNHTKDAKSTYSLHLKSPPQILAAPTTAICSRAAVCTALKSIAPSGFCIPKAAATV